MLKKINCVLGLLGLKLIRPRRYAPKSEARRVKEFVSEFQGPPNPEPEWQHIPDNPPGVVKSTCVGKSPYVGTCVSNPGNEGRTHYVGDDCPGGHLVGTENCCIGPEAKMFVGNPNANFVPVDIGADDHEINRVEQEANKLVEKCCGLDSHPYRVDETPRVKQPNSDNKISGPTS